MTSGWIPVSVLLLFAAALVMGQPGSDLHGHEDSAVPDVMTRGRIMRDELHSVRYLIGSIRQVSDKVELAIDAHGALADGVPAGATVGRGGQINE